MDQETIRRHINQQLHNVMAADMDVDEYLESALVHTKKCLENSAGKYHVNLWGGG